MSERVAWGMPDPRTDAGRLAHLAWHEEDGLKALMTGDPGCGNVGCGLLGTILAIEAEAIEAAACTRNHVFGPLDTADTGELARLREAATGLRDLLAEGAGVGEWDHAHCDEASDGTHRLDRTWWEDDAEKAIAAFDRAALAAIRGTEEPDPEYHEHVAGDKHSHAFNGPHSHGGVSALRYPAIRGTEEKE